MSAYFITGTDTDCGKTYVSCALLNYWKSQGLRAQALKPLASGVQGTETDLQRLQRHNTEPSLKINCFSFAPPIAPHIAAELEGEVVSAQSLALFCQQSTFQDFDRLLIEGAGGFLVPLNTKETWEDFVRLMHIPVILVVGIKLGCINHALLTSAYLQNQGLDFKGWIANELNNDPINEKIINILVQKMRAPLLTRLQYYGKIGSLLLDL